MQIIHIPAKNRYGRYSHYNFKPGALVHRMPFKTKSDTQWVAAFVLLSIIYEKVLLLFVNQVHAALHEGCQG
ncbi:hypothetical protein BD749_2533 [Pontibacter ramchanderi]|uniref:Uncharacterized protein n=1 Tax=Pontibacter ramchanderi TaxID=1179743 RepID=A0A2N3UDC1_9BACT|nr:hypothetical protein BD749_2533 [Pontibacter ramchanderi]